MTNYINYALMIIGIFTVFIALTFIYLDKVKGEDIYFNLDVKEQEVKKVIEDAEEVITELNYTSEHIVKEMEETITKLRGYANSASIPTAHPPASAPATALPQAEENIKKTTPTLVVGKLNRLTASKKEKKEEKVNRYTEKQRKVFECADQGLSITDIAKKLNMGHGEVALILSLKEKQKEDEYLD